MIQNIIRVTILVHDYEPAIEFYTNKMGLVLIENTRLDKHKRWVVVGPSHSKGCQLLLAKAANTEQKKSIGNQTGGRVFLFLETDNFDQDYQRMKQLGIKFREHPREEEYGSVVVFEDLYGNLWDLVQPKELSKKGS
jgi:catechol 2,3-dioxygenase-like lactoylglutathione lyase family enzyme